MKPAKIYVAIKKELEKYFSSELINVQNYDQTYLDKIADNEGSVKILLDRANFKVLTISSNVEALTGYSYEEWIENDMFLMFTVFISGEDNFIFTWIKSANLILETAGSLLNYKAAFCGMSMTHKLGHTIHTLWRFLPIEVTDDFMIKTAIISIDDISHLMKGNAYWGRSVFGELPKPQYCYIHSKENIHVFHDILSDREKEVLRNIARGLDSKEIAKLLFISPNTVDNHRRNMLNRTGSRDTTSLIQICRMCMII